MSKTYTVTADNLAGHDRGDKVTADDLPATTNLDALVASGHIKPDRATKPEPKGKK